MQTIFLCFLLLFFIYLIFIEEYRIFSFIVHISVVSWNDRAFYIKINTFSYRQPSDILMHEGSLSRPLCRPLDETLAYELSALKINNLKHAERRGRIPLKTNLIKCLRTSDIRSPRPLYTKSISGRNRCDASVHQSLYSTRRKPFKGELFQ